MSTIDYDTDPTPLEYAKRIDTVAIRNHSENITPDSYNDYLDVTSTRMK